MYTIKNVQQQCNQLQNSLKHACNSLVNTGVAPNVKLGINSILWQDFSWQFRDISLSFTQFPTFPSFQQVVVRHILEEPGLARFLRNCYFAISYRVVHPFRTDWSKQLKSGASRLPAVPLDSIGALQQTMSWYLHTTIIHCIQSNTTKVSTLSVWHTLQLHRKLNVFKQHHNTKLYFI